MTLALLFNQSLDAVAVAIPATATWSEIAPAVSADANVTAVAAVPTWSETAPTISAEGNVTSVTATESIAGVIPSIAADAGVTAIAASEAWIETAPVVSPMDAQVLATVAVLNVLAGQPGVVGAAQVTAAQNAPPKYGRPTLFRKRPRNASVEIQAVAGEAVMAAPTPIVGVDVFVASPAAEAARMEAIAPQAKGSVIHILAPQRFIVQKLTLEKVDGHFVIRELPAPPPASKDEAKKKKAA